MSPGVRAGPPHVVALVGPRGAGKSTLGAALAGRLGWAFADADQALGFEVGCPAGAYLELAGERAFRRVEQRVSLGLLARPGVVALGGGAVLAPAIRSVLTGRDVFTVLVCAPPDALAQRIRASGAHRPALTDRPLDDEVRLVLARRRSLYERVADLEVQTFPANVDSCCGAILARMPAAP